MKFRHLNSRGWLVLCGCLFAIAMVVELMDLKGQNMKHAVGNKTEEPRILNIMETLVVLNRGNTLIDAGRDFQDVVDGIKATNKAGELTIKLKVKPSGWVKGTGIVNQVDIEPEIIAKIPRHDQGKSIFFVTDDNKLTRDDPGQEALFKEQ